MPSLLLLGAPDATLRDQPPAAVPPLLGARLATPTTSSIVIVDRAGKVASIATGAPRRHRSATNHSYRKTIPMPLRAIAAAAVVLSVIAAPRLQAQDSSVGRPTAVMLSGPDVGRRAPAFRLPWANKDGVGPADQPYDLALDRGRTVVLAFFPRDFTNGCTAEMRTFAEQYDSLFGSDVVVVGISTDSLETHTRFATSLSLPFRLLSDPRQEVARRYASNDRSGYMRRTVYVVGPDGRVKYRNIRFNALDPNHYAELGAAVRRARGG